MMFARVFSLASNVGFWIGIVRIAVLNRSGFLMFSTSQAQCFPTRRWYLPCRTKRADCRTAGINKKRPCIREGWSSDVPSAGRQGLFCFKQKFIKSYTRSRSSSISSFAAAFWCCRGLMIRQISRLGASSMSGIRQTVRLFKASRASSSG